jgi:hypothetical protein
VTPEQQIDAVVRRERLRLIRNWCFGLGLGACVIAALSVGGAAIINSPKVWAPTGGPSFSAALVIAGGGYRWLAGPLLVCGAALLVVALFLTVRVTKR